MIGAWLVVACMRLPPEPPLPTTETPRPNVLLVVADDLGYADLGSFGSDIRTPHLDRLAEAGVRATRFHTAPMCAPTRAMLLSGNNNHVAGMGTQSPDAFLRRHVRGFEGHLPERIAPLPRLLRDAGYHTYMVGKWHLGTEAEHAPSSAGFERSFGLVDGAGSHFDPSASLPPRNPDVVPWTALTDAERRAEAREMELYAAMVENLDHHVGRLLAHLETLGVADDTLVIFMSDNGAAGEDFYASPPFADYVRAYYDNALDGMGGPGSWVSYGPAWAEAGSAPFRGIKTSTLEGGISAPLIVAGAGVEPRGAIDDRYVTVMDIAPTVLQAAGVPYPASGVAPLRGRSLGPMMRGETGPVHSEDDVTALYHRGRAYVRQGRWKLVDAVPPFAEAEMALFDVVADPGETRDRSADAPDVRDRLLALWRTQRRELGIVLPGDL